MNAIRNHRLFQAVIVAMTFVAWLALANHCALGGLGQRPQPRSEHSCCLPGESPSQQGSSHGQQAPADHQPGLQCCQSLHAVTVQKVDFAPPLFLALFLAVQFTFSELKAEPQLITGDTGPPPHAISFSELVLHRSLRSHAPPVSA